MSFIHEEQGILHMESLSIERLAQHYPTPFHCYSANAIRQQYRNFCEALAPLPALV